MLNASNEKAVQVSWEILFATFKSWSHERNVGIWVIARSLKWAVPEAKIIRLQYLKFGVEWFLNMQTWTWTGWETRMVWKQIWRNISLLTILMEANWSWHPYILLFEDACNNLWVYYTECTLCEHSEWTDHLVCRLILQGCADLNE